MKPNVSELIELWFEKHGDDGEFVRSERGVPFSLIGPLSHSRGIVFTTKPSVVTASIESHLRPVRFGMLGKYGGPRDADLPRLHEHTEKRELVFLGDMDPVDLLIYAWLRERLAPRIVSYLGLGDELLASLEMSSTESIRIRCTRSERQAVALLNKVFPDYPDRIGDNCAALLRQGYKIELEAMLGSKQLVVPVLESAVLAH